MKQEFGDAVLSLSKSEFKELLKSLLGILYSHRYKKDDKFLEGVDFMIVRDVLYNYTTEGRNRFIELPFNAFLFHHFVVHGGSQFLVSKAAGRQSLFAIELETELSSINNQAEAILNC